MSSLVQTSEGRKTEPPPMHRKRRLREPVNMHRRRRNCMKAVFYPFVRIYKRSSQAFLQRFPCPQGSATDPSPPCAGNLFVDSEHCSLKTISYYTINQVCGRRISEENLRPQARPGSLSRKLPIWHTDIRRRLQNLTRLPINLTSDEGGYHAKNHTISPYEQSNTN